MAGAGADGTDPAARYVFTVRFRLDPTDDAVHLDPSVFETTLYRTASPPGEPGWRFFRDNLWRGEVADDEHVRSMATDVLGVPVENLTFRELETDAAYLADLKAAIADDLQAFNGSSVTEVVSKYLGSSIRVVDPE